MLMTVGFPLEMSERAFVCRLALLSVDTCSGVLVEGSFGAGEMFSGVDEGRICVVDVAFGTDEGVFSGNEQQKV